MSRVVLGVCGSAACFKAVSVASALTRGGHEVDVVMTHAATRLVTPLQFAAVTGRAASYDEWTPHDPGGMDHIALARGADLLLVCPATADRLAAFAHGHAPDLLGSLELALPRRVPRVLVPAMNPTMWEHPRVRANVAALEADGWRFVGPTAGLTACGDEGEGRMAEPAEVVAAVERLLR